MSRILELYQKILDLYQQDKNTTGRFVDEVFELEYYAPGVANLTIVDLGAYEGEFGYYCYNFAKVIYAVEPDPRPFEIMKQRVGEFGLDKFKLFNIAISGKSGIRPFHNTGYGGSSLGVGGDTMDIETLSLADFIDKEKIEKVDILKIDVESSEIEIFSADDFPSVSDRIQTIVGEVHGGEEIIKDKLTTLGFEYKSFPNCFVAKR